METPLRAWLAGHWTEVLLGALAIGMLVLAIVFVTGGNTAPSKAVAPNAPGAGAPPAEGALRSTVVRRLSRPTAYAIDTMFVNGVPQKTAALKIQLTMPHPSSLEIKGWAIDILSQQTAAAVVATIDGGTQIVARCDGDRPDVAEALKNPAYRPSGFELFMPPDVLPRGHHSIAFRVLDHASDGYYELPKTVTVDVH